MATRMQQRRGTASQWTSANPVLAAGEIGFEIDTNKFKMGDGINQWADLDYFLDEAALDGSLGDYVPLSQKGAANGVATLDGGGSIPVSQLGNLIADAPELLNTLEEISAALGDDPNFVSKVVPIIKKTTTQWQADTSLIPSGTLAFNTTTGGLKMGDGATAWADTPFLMNQEDVATEIAEAVDGILEDSTFYGTINLPATTNIGFLTSTEIGYLATVTSDVQTQINDAVADIEAVASDVSTIENTLNSKANLSNPTFDGTVVLPTTTSIGDVSSTEIGYLNGVTSSVQTQLDAKLASATASSTYAPLSGPTFSGNVSLPSTTTIGNVSATELGYVDGVTSAIQTQLDSKAPTANPTFTGTVAGVTKGHVGLGNVDNTSDANKPVSTATQTALDAKLNLSGGTLTGALTLSGAPTSDLHAVTKQYVDGLAAGINFHQPVVAATTGNLAGTYNNGTNGVGATLTRASNGSIGTIDGATVSVGNRILLRAQTDAKENGVYVITAVGSGSAPWVITRATDADNNPSGELATGDFTFVTSGSTNGSKGFIVSTTGTITIGTTEINYAQFNASEAVVAGTNISKSGETISVVNAPTFSGLVTASSGVAFSDGTQTLEGVPSRTVIIQRTSSNTLSGVERDDLIEMSSTSATTLTIPADSTFNFPIGTSIDVLQTNTGQVTIAGAGGVTVNATPGLKLRTQWSSATLFKRAANTWVVYGDLTA
jgi:hypothetical protein